jgi:glucose-6-phosphate dehydrogenase assembly protein OpcA
VVVGDGEGERPRAWVNITCHAAGRGQQQVCSERLILQAPAGALHQVIGSVAGLLVADLPAFLWWRGRPPANDLERERFNHLARVVDRVVLDSARLSGEELAGAAELVRAYPRLAFGDLNWARLTSWRAAVAQVFDPPAMQAQLASLSRARIAHPGGEPSAAVRLLAGWLQSRLQPPPEVEMTGSDAEVVELDLAGGTIRVPRPVPPTDAQALSEELRIVGHDAVFKEALYAATGSPE